MCAQVELSIWRVTELPKLRSFNACNILVCSYGFNCHTLHDYCYQTKISEHSGRGIGQRKRTTVTQAEKCAEDVNCHRGNVHSMLAARHNLVVPYPLSTRQHCDGILRLPIFQSYCLLCSSF